MSDERGEPAFYGLARRIVRILGRVAHWIRRRLVALLTWMERGW